MTYIARMKRTTTISCRICRRSISRNQRDSSSFSSVPGRALCSTTCQGSNNGMITLSLSYLSVTIENFCFSEIVPARLTKTISLTNVQHFGHFFLLQLNTKSTTHSTPTLTWTQFTATTTFLLKLCRGCISPQYSDVDINLLSLVMILSIQLNFHSWMPVAEWS